MVAVGAAGQQPQVGVRGFGQRVGDAVFEGVMNQCEEPFDRFGPCHELGDAGSAGPGQPAGEQLFAFGAFECEDLAELF